MEGLKRAHVRLSFSIASNCEDLALVDIRIKDLPSGTPVASKKLPMDLTTTESATIKDIVYAGRPAASQAEAEAGIDADKVMTSVATKQSIASEVGVTLASYAQGLAASTALQESDVASVAISGDYNDLLNKPDVASVTQQSFIVTPGQTSVTIVGGYAIGKIYQVFLNGVLLDNGSWSASNGSTVTFSAITNNDIIEGESSAYLTVAIGAPSSLIPALDARYLRLTSDPRKDLFRLGVRSDGDPAYDADNTAIYAEAISDSATTELYFGPGQFSFTNLPVISNRQIDIGGLGKGVSALIYTAGGTGHGVQISQNARGYQSRVHDLTIANRGTATGARLIMTYPLEVSSDLPGPIVDNVSFSGVNNNADTSGADIILNEAWLPRISNCHFRGVASAFAGDAIRLSGACTDGHIYGNWAVYRDRCVYIAPQSGSGGASEGLNIFMNNFVGVNFGVFADAGNNYPGLKVMYNHINARRKCIVVDGRPQVDVSHNLLYRWTTGEIDPWIGVLMSNGCQDFNVQDNKIYGFKDEGTQSATAIYALSSNGGTVSGNKIIGTDNGVDFGGNSKSLAESNTFSSTTTKVGGLPSGSLARQNINIDGDGNMTSFDGAS